MRSSSPTPPDDGVAPSSTTRRWPVELGATTFLLEGPATSGFVGASVFVSDLVGRNVFLRPSAAFGETPAAAARATWGAARLDVCTRIPGNYETDQGLQLDLCGGGDVGFTYFVSGTGADQPARGRTFPYADLGVSLGLRGEIGDRSAVWLRAFGGINVVRAGFLDARGDEQTSPIASFRLELGFSWGR